METVYKPKDIASFKEVKEILFQYTQATEAEIEDLLSKKTSEYKVKVKDSNWGCKITELVDFFRSRSYRVAYDGTNLFIWTLQIKRVSFEELMS